MCECTCSNQLYKSRIARYYFLRSDIYPQSFERCLGSQFTQSIHHSTSLREIINARDDISRRTHARDRAISKYPLVPEIFLQSHENTVGAFQLGAAQLVLARPPDLLCSSVLLRSVLSRASPLFSESQSSLLRPSTVPRLSY